MQRTTNISEQQLGKDHWSLLAYIGTRCQDHKGVLNPEHLRIKHPALRTGLRAWKPEWGTRLSGYWKEDGTTDSNLLLPDHDDMDCFDDLEEAGYIESYGTGLNPSCILTKKGLATIQRLIEHKQMGKHYATFTIEAKASGVETLRTPPTTEVVGIRAGDLL